MKFRKGQSGNPNGRPKGIKNKATQNYLDFQLWFGMIVKDLEFIKDPEERIKIACRVIDQMLTKVQTLPGTPGESVRNANQAAEVLKQLEAPAVKPEPIQEPVKDAIS